MAECCGLPAGGAVAAIASLYGREMAAVLAACSGAVMASRT